MDLGLSFRNDDLEEDEERLLSSHIKEDADADRERNEDLLLKQEIHDVAMAEVDLVRFSSLCCACGRSCVLGFVDKFRRKRSILAISACAERAMLARVRRLATTWLEYVSTFEESISREDLKDLLVKGRLLPSHRSKEERLRLISQYQIPEVDGRIAFLDLLFIVVLRDFIEKEKASG